MKGNKSIQVTDVTLRDGSYGIMHKYTKEQVEKDVYRYTSWQI